MVWAELEANWPVYLYGTFPLFLKERWSYIIFILTGFPFILELLGHFNIYIWKALGSFAVEKLCTDHSFFLFPSLPLPLLLPFSFLSFKQMLKQILGFPRGSEVKVSACNAGDLGSICRSGRSPGEGNGNPLQYSCLENPMDGGAWWVTVHGVAKSWTRLSDFAHSLKTNLCVNISQNIF